MQLNMLQAVAEVKTINLAYDIFSDSWYQVIESIVLGEHQFNDEQKKYIHFMDTAIIEAGPGSGKTTALSAKVALLLKKIEDEGNQEAICVITHTNAAVTEIQKTLKQIGFQDIPHPHFIGTINEFFNRFGMYPEVALEKNVIDIQFYEEAFLTRYFKEKLSKNHRWMNSSKDSFKKSTKGVITRLLQSHVFLGKSNKLTAKTVESGAFEKYRDDYLKYKQEAWNEGIYHVNDTFYFSQRYFSNTNIQKVMRNRFKYIFMDEYQDAAPLPLELLKRLFNHDSTVFQMIGDKNQHISYSNPTINEDGLPTYYLNETIRFGEKISQPLNRMFQGSLEPLDSTKSRKSILYVYKSASTVKEDFSKILSEAKIIEDRNKKAILIAARWQAGGIGQNIEKTVNVRQNSKLQEAKIEVYRLLSNKMDVSIKSVQSLLNRNWLESELKINQHLLEFLRDSSEDTEGIKKAINYFFKISKQKAKINSSNSLFQKLDRIKGEAKSNQSKLESIPLKTIHEVKGQTLTANLVYLHKGSKEEFGFLTSYGTDMQKPSYYSEIDKRVVYVGMSRPTTLLVVALHADSYFQLSDETKEVLKEDFEVVECSEL